MKHLKPSTQTTRVVQNSQQKSAQKQVNNVVANFNTRLTGSPERQAAARHYLQIDSSYLNKKNKLNKINY